MFLEPLLQKFHYSYGDKKEDEDIRQPAWNRHENLQDAYNHGEKLIRPELYRKTPDTDCAGRTFDRAGDIAEHFHRPRPPPPPAPNHRHRKQGRSAPLFGHWLRPVPIFPGLDFEPRCEDAAVDFDYSDHEDVELLLTITNEDMTMDYDDSPIAKADTGIRKEYTHEEVEAMLERDEAYHTFLRQQREMFTMLHKVLDELDREEHEETVEMTSIAREKILRGMRLSDEELDTTVFGETCRLIFGKITTKEFLRRMLIVCGLADLDSE